MDDPVHPRLAQPSRLELLTEHLRRQEAELDAARARVAELEEENAAQRRTEEQRLSQRIELMRAALDAVPAAETTGGRAVECTCSGTATPPEPAEMDPSCPAHGIG